MVEAGPTAGGGSGWEPAAPPPRLEGAERERNMQFDFLSYIKVGCVCAFPPNTENTEKKAKGQGRRLPLSTPGAPGDVNRAFWEPLAQAAGPEPPQRATPRAGSLGQEPVRSMRGGPSQGRRTIGPL